MFFMKSVVKVEHLRRTRVLCNIPAMTREPRELLPENQVPRADGGRGGAGGAGLMFKRGANRAPQHVNGNENFDSANTNQLLIYIYIYIHIYTYI